jgi:hypothetical protein
VVGPLQYFFVVVAKKHSKFGITVLDFHVGTATLLCSSEKAHTLSET